MVCLFDGRELNMAAVSGSVDGLEALRAVAQSIVLAVVVAGIASIED